MGIAADIMAHQGAAATAGVGSAASMATRGNTLESDFAAGTAISDVLGDQYTTISAWRSGQVGLLTYLKTLLANMTIRMVNDDAGLDTKDLATAMRELRRQMRANSTSIEAGSISIGSQTAVGSPTGTLKVIASVNDYEGYTLQTIKAEKVRATVKTDSQTGATARNEQIEFKGQAAPAGGDFDYLWLTSGSGASKTLNVVDSRASNSKGNLLYNSSFTTATTSNILDDWRIVLGTAGSTITQSASGGMNSGAALVFTGDSGGTLLTLRQHFDTAHSTSANSGGTPAELEPLTQYGCGLWWKRSATLSAGVLRVALVDGDGTVTNDASGTANSFTVDLTGSGSTSFAFASGTFRVPAVIPSTGLRLELKTTTAIDDTDTVTIDDVSFSEMTELYPRGPSFVAVAGATDPIIGDQWTLTTSVTMGKFAMWLERFLGLRALDIQLPYDASPTVDDDLVV